MKAKVKLIHEIRKTLSPNDLGLTGSHQAGILIPKALRETGFFPELAAAELNPRVSIICSDESTGINIQLTYIFYNGKELGLSTRSEFRLTGLTSYLRQQLARVGDELVLVRKTSSEYAIDVIHADSQKGQLESHSREIIRLTGNWSSIRGGKTK